MNPSNKTTDESDQVNEQLPPGAPPLPPETELVPSDSTPPLTAPSQPESPEQQERSNQPKRKRLLLLVGIVVAVIVLAAAAWFLLGNKQTDKTATPDQSSQKVVKKLGVAVGLSEGLVQYSSDAKSWQDLSAQTNLKEGDSVRTTNGSRVVLLIDDGSAVRLSANSEVKLTSLSADSIVVANTSGEVYSRVVPSTTREYKVAVGTDTYTAKGTAYRTINKDTRKGVEVFHSAVVASKDKQEVAEGKYLFTKHEQTDKQGAVLALDVEALKSDDFIKWNKDQDKKVAEYADKMGILTELDKPAPTPPPVAAPKPASTATTGITLSGKQSEYSAVFSWKTNGIDTSKGFKLVRSSKTTTPTYPNDSVAYISSEKTNYTLYVGDGATYNYRLCAYRDGSCVSYSNTVKVTTLKKVKEAVQAGAVTLGLSGNNLNWTYQGTAPYGFKIVVGTSSGPTYSSNYKKYYTEGTNYQLPGTDFSAGTSYYVKVCKYNDGNCTDYSNEVVYTP